MHGLNYIASSCVDSEYHCSIFLLGPWTWPPSTCLFLHCNVLLVFLLFSPSLDSGFRSRRGKLKETFGMKRQMCNVSVQSWNKMMLLHAVWLHLTQITCPQACCFPIFLYVIIWLHYKSDLNVTSDSYYVDKLWSWNITNNYIIQIKITLWVICTMMSTINSIFYSIMSRFNYMKLKLHDLITRCSDRVLQYKHHTSSLADYTSFLSVQCWPHVDKCVLAHKIYLNEILQTRTHFIETYWKDQEKTWIMQIRNENTGSQDNGN